jgi:hypothetical protein
MEPRAPHIGGRPGDDVIPSMPLSNPNTQPPFQPLTQADASALQRDAANLAADLRDSARRIESAAKAISAVASTTTVKLTRNDKIKVGASAAALVGIGVVGTMGWQALGRRRAARRMTVTTK